MKNINRFNKYLSRKTGKYLSKYSENWIKNPVFIIGSARSGTTLIGNLLGLHKDIANFSEANEIWDPFGYPWRDSNLKRPPNWIDPYKFNEMWWQEVSQGYYKEIKGVFGVFQKLSVKKVFINKTPMNTFKIPYLLEMFPNAKFINIYRDGRAVTLSYFKKTYSKLLEKEKMYKSKGYFFGKDELLNILAKFWVEHLKEVEKQRGVLDIEDRMYEVSYENFCNNPKGELSGLYDFINLKASRSGIKKTPIIKNMNYKYKEELSKKQIESITEIMTEMLENRGYQI